MAEPGPHDGDDKFAACNREFDLYESYRKDVLRIERQAEKSFDTFLGTICVAAIGSTFTLLGSVDKGDGKGWIIASWVFFAVCLLLSLCDRLATYHVNKRGREIYDKHFDAWSEGAFKRATAEALAQPLNYVLEYTKWIATVLFSLGLLSLFIGIASSWSPVAASTLQAPVVMNVYNVPTTQVKP